MIAGRPVAWFSVAFWSAGIAPEPTPPTFNGGNATARDIVWAKKKKRRRNVEENEVLLFLMR